MTKCFDPHLAPLLVYSVTVSVTVSVSPPSMIHHNQLSHLALVVRQRLHFIPKAVIFFCRGKFF